MQIRYKNKIYIFMNCHLNGLNSMSSMGSMGGMGSLGSMSLGSKALGILENIA